MNSEIFIAVTLKYISQLEILVAQINNICKSLVSYNDVYKT